MAKWHGAYVDLQASHRNRHLVSWENLGSWQFLITKV